MSDRPPVALSLGTMLRRLAVMFAGACAVCSAQAFAGRPCGSHPGDCCVGGGAPGCSDAACCEKVCAFDPFCCSVAWDGLCAAHAQELCENCRDPCRFSCPPNAVPEGEPCGTDTNGGCDSGLFQPIEEGVICGTFWGDAGERDEDMYTFTLDRNAVVSWTVKTTTPMILKLTDQQCPPFVYTAASVIGCGFELSTCLVAGSYTATVAPVAMHGLPCGQGAENEYVATLAFQESCVVDQCGAEGDCCTPHPWPFCDNVDCCNLVCAIDPFCCRVEWDKICVLHAKLECRAPCRGDACGVSQVDCCHPMTLGPGCNDVRCCQTVCAVDPFCCESNWDGICGGEAQRLCAICSPSCAGDLDGRGQVDAADLAALLGQWGGAGSGDLDASGSVNAADLAILLGAWGACT